MKKSVGIALALILMLSGCSPQALVELAAGLKQLLQTVSGDAPAPQPRSILVAALNQYQDGNYAEAEKALKSALDRGLSAREAALAHKHLAFLHCAADRMQQCRAEFELALRADPKTDLDPAEAGHPAWGPVFRSVRR